MKNIPLIDQIRHLPTPAESQKSKSYISKLEDNLKKNANYDKYFNSFSKKEETLMLLGSIFGNSPFLSQCINKNPIFFFELLKKDPLETLNFLLNDLKNIDFNPSIHTKNTQLNITSLDTIMKKLRIAKERTALLVAITDIGNVWELEQVVKALSDFADLAISKATRWILLNSYINKEIKIENIENPEKNSGFVILAMGKLGSKELNYSSDVDLISLYDQEKINYTGPDSPHKCYSRMTQLLINILSERTKDGYVFRTDLRLRPDAGATPLSLSMVAAETYYENVGQNWERAAMIKARPIAGDLNSGKQYIDRLKPFIWRKNLDFAAISDIQSIKRQIDAKTNEKIFSIYGHNIKLGNGGIREIELFVQTQQLIAGGRDPLLREASTLNALSTLFERKKISKEAKKQLEEAYKFFRKVEHRLQMVSDEQTHSMPKNHHDFTKFIKFLGYKNEKLFISLLEKNINLVKEHYKKLFETSKELGNEKGSLIFTGSDNDPRTINTLLQMGFEEPDSIVKSIRNWHHGRYRATRSVRSREILTDLIPKLLNLISSTPFPDLSFKRFDGFLSKLSEGAQLFSLFQHNQTLLHLLTKIVGSAPNLSEFLLHNPHVLDIIITNQDNNDVLTASKLEKDLKLQVSFSSDYIEKLDIFRRWTREHRFMIGTKMLSGRLSGFDSSKNFSTLAKIIVRNLLPVVQNEFQDKHGNIPYAKYSILGLGTLGSEEMIFNSDLDLIFIYENIHEYSNSNGSVSLPASTYFAKLSQKFINAITSLTSEGKIYEIDMRLRPSGNAGPVALSLDSFTNYHKKQSWTWEKMALTRARTVAGDQNFCNYIDNFINDTITTTINRNILINDILDMRNKIEKEFSPKSIWQIKHIRGGLLDCQFLAQFFQLNFASKYPAVISNNTIKVFKTLETLDIYDKSMFKTLKKNTILQHKINSIMDLCLLDSKKIYHDPTVISSILLESTKSKNFEKLKLKLSQAQNEVFEIYKKIIQ